MLDPRTCKIQGDLSRADVIVLHSLCQGKRVVEFGMGGSTLLLARCASELDSYEPFENWYEATRKRIGQIPDKTAEVRLHKMEAEKRADGRFNVRFPASVPDCDVMFVDGQHEIRGIWLADFFHKAKRILVHDCRRAKDVQRAIEGFLQYFEWVDSVRFSVDGSNMMLIERRDRPLEWVDWNVTEADDNRVSPEVEEYVP